MRRLLVPVTAVLLLAGCASSTRYGAASKSSVVTEAPAATTAPTSPHVTTPTRQNIQITDKGFTQFPPDSIGASYLTYAVVAYNPNPPTAASPWVASRVSLNITFTNAAGQVVDSQDPTIDNILPGQYTAATDGLVQAKGVTGMTVQASVEDWQQNDRPITGSLTTSGVTTTSSDFGAKTVGTLSSSFEKDYKQVQVDAVFQNAAGQIIGGDHTYVDFVSAKGSVSFSITEMQLPAGVAKTVVYPSFSFMSTMG